MRNPLSAPTIDELFLRSGAATEDRYNEFFPHIRLANGTFKTTTSMRHVDLDQSVSEVLLGDLNGVKRTLHILDLGVSSGTGTVEWSERLSQDGIDHKMNGTDLSLTAECRCVWPFTFLTDSNGFLYQVDFLGLAFPNTPPSKLSGLVFALARCLLPVHRFFCKAAKQVRLLSAKASKSDVTFANGNVFGQLAPIDHDGGFDVIRASNLLNFAYFDREQILSAIENIRRHLVIGGLLVVNRTEEGTNHFTVFKLKEDGFATVCASNNGSEIRSLVLRQ